MLADLKLFASRLFRLFSLGRRQEDDRAFADELDAHLNLLTEENIRRGMTPAEARRQAHIRPGSTAQLHETHRELRSLPFLETLWQDVR